jgi:hypothetical protein
MFIAEAASSDLEFIEWYTVFIGKVSQNLSGPLPELGGPHRVDPVDKGDDCIQIVVVGGACHRFIKPEFPDN